MRLATTTIRLPEGNFNVALQFFDQIDKAELRSIYDQWVGLSNNLQKYGGRRINLPELLSEGTYCLNFNAGRMNGSISGANSSFDCFDVGSNKRIQVKACSVEFDLTSFGPDSVWDEIYFIHFFPNKKYDGSYSIYKIDNNLIYNHKVNSKQTMKQQQQQGKRPRFSIMKELIIPLNIEPIISGVI